MQLIKKCTKCNIEKELSDFYKNKSRKDGIQSNCKICQKEHQKEYRKVNADKVKKRQEEYYKANTDKLKKYQKEYQKEYQKKYQKVNADKIKEYRKEYQKEYQKVNADKKKEKQKEYRKANADKIKERNKKWRKANSDKIREYYKANVDKIKKYRKEKRKTDPLFKFTGSTRCLIRATFKRSINNFTKSKRTEEILGCSIPFFCNYIKGQFTKGMTLENYGEWHLDHINPVSIATTEEEVIELNHYTNFQPLWAFDNLSKNNKLVEKQLKLL